jgi:hypothetical protein
MHCICRAALLASALALPLGVFTPRVAIAPAGLRLVRDVYGSVTNFAAMFMEPTADDRALEIVRELEADQQTARDGRAEQNEKLAKDLAKLDPGARAERLAKLDPATRSTVRRKLRAASMTSSEMALSRLTAEARATAIERITAGMGEAEASAYLARLRSLGLAE